MWVTSVLNPDGRSRSDERERHRAERAEGGAPERPRRLGQGGIDPQEGGAHRSDRLREKADDVRRDQQIEGLVDRLRVRRPEIHEREAEHHPGNGVPDVRRPLEGLGQARAVLGGEVGDRQAGDGGDQRRARRDADGVEGIGGLEGERAPDFGAPLCQPGQQDAERDEQRQPGDGEAGRAGDVLPRAEPHRPARPAALPAGVQRFVAPDVRLQPENQ